MELEIFTGITRDFDSKDANQQRNNRYDSDVGVEEQGSPIAPKEVVGLGGIVDRCEIIGHGYDWKKHKYQQRKCNDCSDFSIFQWSRSEGDVTPHE